MKIYLRMLTKGFLWEVLGIIIAFFIFKDWKPIGLYFVVRTVLYYFYHIIWKTIKFRKVIEIKLR